MNKTNRELYLAGKSKYDVFQIIGFKDKIIVLIDRITYSESIGILWLTFEITYKGYFKYNGLKVPEVLMTPDVNISNISLNINAITQQNLPHYPEVIDSYQKEKIKYFLNNL